MTSADEARAPSVADTECQHADRPHTIWWWLHDPNDPVLMPYSQDRDNLADALESVAEWVKEPPLALRWIKVFRSDNESYTCWRWENPEPLPELVPAAPVVTQRRRRWWRRG